MKNIIKNNDLDQVNVNNSEFLLENQTPKAKSRYLNLYIINIFF